MNITLDTQNPSLATKSISAVKWYVLGHLISLSLQFGIVIILARFQIRNPKNQLSLMLILPP